MFTLIQEPSKIAVQRGLTPENYIQTALIPITATSTGPSNPLPNFVCAMLPCRASCLQYLVIDYMAIHA